MIVFRGAEATLVCNTIELSSERPKTNVVSATVEVVAEDGTTVFGPAVCAVEDGYVEANWTVPGGLAHDSGKAIFSLVDSAGITGKAVDDVQITNLAITPANVQAIVDALAFLVAIEGGRWRIDKLTGVMSFYASDNMTEVASFQLYDRNGVITASPSQAYERRRLT